VSKVVYKYELKPKTQLTLRRGAKLLSVGRQPSADGDIIVAWFLVQLAQNAEERRAFICVPTGAELRESGPEKAYGVVYRGTVTGVDGSLVFHVFEDRSGWQPIPYLSERFYTKEASYEVVSQVDENGDVVLMDVQTGHREKLSMRWIVASGWWGEAP